MVVCPWQLYVWVVVTVRPIVITIPVVHAMRWNAAAAAVE